MKLEGLEEKIKALAEPVAAALGLELVDLEYKMEHGKWVLRIFIDKPGGVTLDDCSDLSRELSTTLDVEDPIPQSYTLEVSSPGLDRPLVKEKDFKRYIGHKAKIKSKKPLDGRKNFKGTIDGVEEGRIHITDFDGKKFTIELANIDRARLEIEF